MSCEYLDRCPFFAEEMANMPTVSATLKRHYCRDRFFECARYLVTKQAGREFVPADLLPTHVARADTIVDALYRQD